MIPLLLLKNILLNAHQRGGAQWPITLGGFAVFLDTTEAMQLGLVGTEGKPWPYWVH